MRLLCSPFLMLIAACTVERGPRVGCEITVHDSADSVAECLKELPWKEPLEPLDVLFTLRGDSTGRVGKDTHEGELEFDGRIVEVGLIAWEHSTGIELMATGFRQVRLAERLITEALESGSISFDPVELGEVGR